LSGSNELGVQGFDAKHPIRQTVAPLGNSLHAPFLRFSEFGSFRL